MTNRRTFIAATAAATTAMAADAVKGSPEPKMSLNVVYPNQEGSRFDLDYYRSTHIPMAMKVMKADSVELIEGVPNGTSPPPIVMIAQFRFASPDALKAALANPAMADVRADVAKFTGIRPAAMVGRTL